MSKIVIADTAPMYCSGCFQQKVDSIHVDLGAAWDGPVIQGYPVDDLVLCEGCLTAAGKLVGLHPAKKAVADLAAARGELERQGRELERVREYAGHLEAAISARGDA